MAAEGVNLSVVVPCYNEEQRLPSTIEKIEAFLDRRADSYELILVDDGSADGTSRGMDEAAARHSSVPIQALPANRGKGRALAEGVKVSRRTTVLVTDAVLSTPIDKVPMIEAQLAAAISVTIASLMIMGLQCLG